MSYQKSIAVFCFIMCALCSLSYTACTTIPNLPVELSDCSNTVPVATSGMLGDFDPAFAQYWEQTYCYCFKSKENISREIELREKRLTKKRTWLLTIGSLAAFASTIYAGVNDNPKEDVLIPLGLVSGASLTTALPSLSQDDRIRLLRDRYARITAQESFALSILNEIDQLLLERGAIEERLDEHKMKNDVSALKLYPELTGKSENELRQKYLSVQDDLQTKLGELRSHLAVWIASCQGISE